jgi:hypothetical protein
MSEITDERLHEWADYYCTVRDNVCSDDDYADDGSILCEHHLARALLAAREEIARLNHCAKYQDSCLCGPANSPCAGDSDGLCLSAPPLTEKVKLCETCDLHLAAEPAPPATLADVAKNREARTSPRCPTCGSSSSWTDCPAHNGGMA